jgi:hypothetical protein
MTAAALLVAIPLAAALKPPPIVNVGSAWPPPGASAQHLWLEGVSSGPLGRAADRVFEQSFRAGLAAELGHDVPDYGFAGIVKMSRQLVTNRRGAVVTAASRRVLQRLFPDWPPRSARLALLSPQLPPVEGRIGLLYWFEVLFVPCTFPVPSLYLPCTLPVPSLYLPCTGSRCSSRGRCRPSPPGSTCL